MSIWTYLKGGWKTHGPNALVGPAGFDSSSSDSPYDSVTADTAIKLSAVYACVSLRSNTIGTLPLHLRDEKKNVIRDHPLYSVLHDSPNAMQTAAEYWTMCQAHVDMFGNAISIVERRSNKSVISLEPVDPTNVQLLSGKSGKWYYDLGGEKYNVDRILHLKGFSLRAGMGLPRMDIGRHIIASQIAANDSAAKAFKQGLKMGGFFEPTIANLTTEQKGEWEATLAKYARPEHAGQWLTLLKGFKPVGGSEFRIKPAEAELLQSRYFGIEEICRLFNTPPQLIGHTDKASSWASSIEQINLFFLMYGLQPDIVRHEQRIFKTLLSTEDRVRGHQAKFSVQGLLRSDIKTQSLVFASALQNGYYSVNEVRDLLDRTEVKDGDEYRVQLNMVQLGQETAPPEEPKPSPPPQKSEPLNVTVNIADRKATGFKISRDADGNVSALPNEDKP